LLAYLGWGSGMQKVILQDQSTKRVDILLTHLHFDHIQGLVFFNPLFETSKEIHIWAPVSTTSKPAFSKDRFKTILLI